MVRVWLSRSDLQTNFSQSLNKKVAVEIDAVKAGAVKAKTVEAEAVVVNIRAAHESSGSRRTPCARSETGSWRESCTLRTWDTRTTIINKIESGEKFC
jgi:hypothetical protein